MGHYFTNDESLKSNIQKVDVDINNTKYYFYTDNGVFSKGELDFGTELLLNNFKYTFPQDKIVLDIGCGCGPIGVFLAKQGFDVEMSDVNEHALELCKRTISEQKLKANIFASDAYENINKKYDYIVTNPPIRVGKKILYDILMNAKDHLITNGELWLVVRKKQGADSLLKDMQELYKTEVIIKKKGFYIIKATI